MSREKHPEIIHALQLAGRVLGVRLCLHEWPDAMRLPLQWREHANPACLEVKSTRQARCAAFCGGEVHRELRDQPAGRIHTCPFGHTEMAVPIYRAGSFAGILFGGPCWTGAAGPPREGLIPVRALGWLEDRLEMLRLVAARVGQLLARDDADAPADRRGRILDYIHAHRCEAIRVKDLAATLHLSPSRTGHLVREIFEETVPSLVRRLKMETAAHYLVTTGWPISEVGAHVGYEDQAHFTRSFTHVHGMPPNRYRALHPRRA